MMRPGLLMSGQVMRVIMKMFFIAVAALILAPECFPRAGPASPVGFQGRGRGVVFENFRFAGEDFSVSAERLELVIGEKAYESPFLPRLNASGFELKLNKSAGNAAADVFGFFSRASSSVREIEIDDGAVLFESAPSFFPAEGIFFEGLRLTPEQDAFFLEAENFGAGEFQVSGLKADIRSEGDFLVFPSVSGVFAGGEFLVEGRAGTGERGIAFSGSVKDLLVERIPGTPGGDMSGRAELFFELSGDPGRPASLSCRAQARLSDGNIRKLPGLRGLAPAFLRVSYEDAVFTGGEASLMLRDGVFLLQNARLNSEEASIGAAGSIMLDGTLDIIVEASFTEQYMRRRSGPASVFAHFLKICDYFMIRHRIAGTLAEPYYEPMPLPAVTMLPLQAGRILDFLLPMRAGGAP